MDQKYARKIDIDLKQNTEIDIPSLLLFSPSSVRNLNITSNRKKRVIELVL